MPPVERRFLTGFRKPDDNNPGLIQEDDETVWVILPDGSRALINGSGVAALVDLTDVDSAGLAVGDTPTWAGTEFTMQPGGVGPQGPTGPTGPAGTGGAQSEYQLDGAVSKGATTITLDRGPSNFSPGAGYLVIDPWSTNCEIRRVASVAGDVVTLVNVVTTTATNVSFTAATKKITGTAEIISRCFPGQTIKITGSASNNGTFTVAGYPADGSYDGTYITVVEALTDEAAGASVTIKMDLSRDHANGAVVLWETGPIQAPWFGVKASANTADAANNRLGLQRMIDDAYYTAVWDLYLPGFLAGRYYINAPLYLEASLHLRGANQKSAVIAAAPTFASWNDDVALIQTRRNGVPCRITGGGNDRYFLTGLGLDGENVAFAKSTGYNGSDDLKGTGYAHVGTNTVSIHATLKKNNPSSQNHSRMIYRAVATGTGGNSIRVAHVNDGASQPLTVTVATNDITVHLATNGAGAVTSTTNDVIAAVNGSGAASALVSASLAYPGTYKFNTDGTAMILYNDGTVVANTFALTALDAGTAPFSSGDVGRSIYLGMRYGARNIVSFTSSSEVEVDGPVFVDDRPGLRFAVSPVNGIVGSYNQTSILTDLRVEKMPGYALAFAGCQEFTVNNLITLFSGVHMRLIGVQFGHFADINMEHTLDCYVQFESQQSHGNISRSNQFIGGHIEDVAPCDYFREQGDYVHEGLYLYEIQATTNAASRVLVFDPTLDAVTTYGVIGWQWSGPNNGPTFVDDGKRGYAVPMTDFAAPGGNYTCDHYFAHDGNVTASRRVTTPTAAHDVRVMEKVLLADATTGAFAVTLPPAAPVKGCEFTVKRVNAGGNAVTVVPDGAETIDGAASVSLSSQYDRVTVISNGTNWMRID